MGCGDLIDVDKMDLHHCRQTLKMIIKYHKDTLKEKNGTTGNIIYKAFSKIEDDECDATEADTY